MTCVQVLRAEFKRRHFSYNHHNQRAFYVSQWRLPSYLYIGFRFVLALYMVYGLTHLIVYSVRRRDPTSSNPSSANSTSDDTSWRILPVYFTVWSYTLTLIHMALVAVLAAIFSSRGLGHVTPAVRLSGFTNEGRDEFECSTVPKATSKTDSSSALKEVSVQAPSGPGFEAHLGSSMKTHPPIKGSQRMTNGSADYDSQAQITRGGSLKRHSSVIDDGGDDDETSSSTPWYFKLSWLLSDITSSAAPVVTSIFFIALYPSMPKDDSPLLNIQDTNVHVLNLVFVLIDHLLAARPVRLLHIVAPTLYGGVYIIFSLIVWAADHTHIIYENVLDWNQPVYPIVLTLALAFVFLPLIQFAFFGLYQLKLVLYRKIYGKSFDEVED